MSATISRKHLIAVLFTLTAFAISANSLPALMTTIARDLETPFENFGWLMTLQYISFAAASLTGGWLSIRLGISNRKLVLIGVLMLGLLFMVGAGAWQFWVLILWIVPLGFAGGLTETFGSVMITQFEKRNSSKLLNISQAFYCGGAILAPQLIAFQLSALISWRTIFAVMGGLILIIGLIFVVFTRSLTSKFLTEPKSSTDKFQPLPTAPHEPRRSIDPMFIGLGATLFLYVTIEVATVCWIPAYFEQHHSLTASGAASRLGLLWTGLILGRGLMLVLPDRWTLEPAMLVGAVGMLGSCLLLTMPFSPNITSAIVFLMGVSAGPLWPIIVMISQTSRGSTRFTSGVIALGALGAATGPFVGMQTIQWFGLDRLFAILALLCGLLLLLSLGLTALLHNRTETSMPHEIIALNDGMVSRQ